MPADRSNDPEAQETSGIGWTRTFFPDGSHVAWFDYATMLIGVNEIYDATEFSLHDAGAGIATISVNYAARFHETVHAVQAVAFPFFSRWCVVWRQLVVECAQFLQKSASSIESGLRAVPELLSLEMREALSSHLELLTTRGNLGISVYHLLEVHALLAEASALCGWKSLPDLCEYFDLNAPSTTYRFAFDVVRFVLDDDVTSQFFARLVAAAFCFDTPVPAFEAMLRHVAALTAEERNLLTIDQLCEHGKGTSDLANRFYSRPQKHAVDVVCTWDPLPHAAMCRRLVRHCERERLSLDVALGDFGLLALASLSLDPTILYLPDTDARPVLHLGWLTDGVSLDTNSPDFVESTEFATYKTERLLTAVSQRLLHLNEAGPVDDVPTELSWMSYTAEELAPVRVPVQLPLGRRRLRTMVNELVSSVSIRGLRAPVTKATLGLAYLGHVDLTFVIDTPLEVWQHPDTRRIVRAISDRCPEFPIYLKPTEESLIIWFGSLVDIEATTAEGFDPQHSSAKREFRRFIEAVANCCETTGLNLFPLVDKLLAPLTYEK